MDMLASSTDNFRTPSVLSQLLFSPESDYVPMSNTTSVSNSTTTFSLDSFLSTVSNADSEYFARDAAHMTTIENTSTAIHGFMNGGHSPLNDFLKSAYTSSVPGIQQVTCLPDMTLPIAELAQNPETGESDIQLSSQTSRNLYYLDTDDNQEREQNLLHSFIPLIPTFNGPLQNSLKQSDFSNMCDSSSIYPSMMLDQNNFRLPNVEELFELQLSMGQAHGLHNAAIYGLFASNGKKPNGKIGNEQPMDGRKNRKTQSNRTTFSKFQLDELEKCFQNSPYPDTMTRKRVSILIQLSEAKVQVWLNNRRARYRKQFQKQTQVVVKQKSI